MRIAVLASHNGSGFDALYKAQLEKKLDIEIILLISNNSNAQALQKAKRYKIDNYLINAKTTENPDDEIERLLREYKCDLIFLSGYMKMISPNLTSNFKLINSHPALLPKYGGNGMYGRFVHEAVIANKEKISGVTIHEVNEHYDEGRIILQKELQLAPDESIETLESKIKQLEESAIVEGIAKCLK